MNDFAVLTPYLVPASMPGKKVNLGDGFILRAIERRIGPFRSALTFTSREPPTSAGLAELSRAGVVVLGGANQLNDTFSVWPGASARDVKESGLTFVPFGIGLDGLPKKNRGFSGATREVIEAIHERIEYSSWRCGRTVALLADAFPHLRGRFLMTGCPVLFDQPLLEGSRFHDREQSVAVTVTERDDFWPRESAVLHFVAARFPSARKSLVLHQDFEPSTPFEMRYGSWRIAELFMSKRARLRNLARRLGYQIIVPSSADEAIHFYEGIDFHVGSRLHAHLLFLSRNKRSFLIPVDERPLGFAEYLKFPLVDYRDIGCHFNFDFEVVRENARAAYATMKKFVASIRKR